MPSNLQDKVDVFKAKLSRLRENLLVSQPSYLSNVKDLVSNIYLYCVLDLYLYRNRPRRFANQGSSTGSSAKTGTRQLRRNGNRTLLLFLAYFDLWH
jgi:hypothetical protein